MRATLVLLKMRLFTYIKPLLLLLPFSIIFLSCKKEDKRYVPIKLCDDISRDLDTINKYVLGSWKWAERKLFASQTGEYIYMTPKPEGYNVTLKYLVIQRNFIEIQHTGLRF